MDGRLPAHIEVAGLIRAVQAEGGFATVLAKGERDAGSILVLTVDRGHNPRLFERMPQMDGSRRFTLVKSQSIEKPEEFNEYLTKRRSQDADAWLVELDVPNPERFIEAREP